jgi:hypothetical protein
VVAGSGVIETVGAVGAPLTTTSTEHAPSSPSGSLTVRVRVCAPRDSGDQLKAISPVGLGGAAPSAPSTSELQAAVSSAAGDSASDTVASSATAAPWDTTAPAEGANTAHEGGSLAGPTVITTLSVPILPALSVADSSMKCSPSLRVAAAAA